MSSFNARTKKTSPFLIRTKWGAADRAATAPVPAPGPAPPSPGVFKTSSPGGSGSTSTSTEIQISPLSSRSNSNAISPTPTTPRPGTSISSIPWVAAPFDPTDKALLRFSELAISSSHGKQAAAGLGTHIVTARTAYAKAFVAIHKASKSAGVVGSVVGSERDVADAALALYAGEEVAGGKKDKVARFVDTLHHYHGVFDVLAQVDFGYLTVIWGGMKLLLIMAKNRGDLVIKLTDALVDIGLALSRVEVLLKLYPTARMAELTARLYAAVCEFLEELILLFQRSAVRQMFSSLIRPFEEKFGRVLDRIQRVKSWIQEDALVLHAMQTASMAHHQLDSYLQRQHVEAALRGIPPNHTPDIFLRIKDTLFSGFSHQAHYHESLAATYGVTSGAWNAWFSLEQKHLPSSHSPSESRLTQGLCDAPDFQHALQWSAQQKAQYPNIPSAYIIWTPDMTAHSAIASLIFQIIQQRPTVVSERNFDMKMFARANASVTALWNMFVNLMKALGGCGIYISIGSVGEDEFAVVEKFVKTVKNWDGPPITVTIIHPFNEGFVYDEGVIDIDGAYDVHPSLTTTDALQHVLMLELDIHEVPDMIRTLLWDAVWRETRYAAIGVSFRRLTDEIEAAAEEFVAEKVANGEVKQEDRDNWMAGIKRWMENKVATRNVSEQIQRHLDMVDLVLPEDIKRTLGGHVKRLVFRVDADKVEMLGTKVLSQEQRDRVWASMEEAISPGPVAMFNGALREIVEDALDSFAEVPIRNAKQAATTVVRLLDERLGREGRWKETISDDSQLIVASILRGITTGFELVISALLEETLEEDIVGSG